MKVLFPTYGTDPFALKKSLTNEALKTVQGVDNNYEEMWKRLELKYGRPERLTDSILSDIRKLKNIPDGDHSCFINSVEIIERCYLDLKRVNMDREMNTTTMISEIEKILPPVQKREWILQKKKHNKFEQFLPLLEFLLEEKTAMEYMQSELCCEQRAKIHYTYESKLPASKEPVDRISNPNLSDDLGIQMKQNQEILQKVVDGLAQITELVCQGHQSFNNNRSARMNTSKLCWYHDTNSHEIEQCWTFNRMDVNSKLDCVRKNKACFICLKIGHLSKNCPNKRGCEHCGKMHHSTLHQEEPQGRINNCLQLVNGEQSGETVILMVSRVKCKDDILFTLWDPGSNVSLISHTAAKRLNVEGVDVTLRISKVGNTVEHLLTKEYIIPLRDSDGEICQIKAYGM